MDIVIFRKWPDGDILALFPEIPADNAGNMCNSYGNAGHSGADYHGCIARTKPATPAEYDDLTVELVRRGYRLTVKQRATYLMAEKRRKASRDLPTNPQPNEV